MVWWSPQPQCLSPCVCLNHHPTFSFPSMDIKKKLKNLKKSQEMKRKNKIKIKVENKKKDQFGIFIK